MVTCRDCVARSVRTGQESSLAPHRSSVELLRGQGRITSTPSLNIRSANTVPNLVNGFGTRVPVRSLPL
ncbi:hypothetical protein J6590_064717, partial [Homalodisca vitripennis]